MHIVINDFRAIKHATLDVNPIALITGPHEAGKTSILQGIAATLIGDRKVFGATEDNLDTVLRNGAQTAAITIEAENWNRTLCWPGDLSESGLAPRTNDIVLGRIHPVGDFTSKQWVTFLHNLAGANEKIITWERLNEELPDVRPEELVIALKKILEQQNPDAALQRMNALRATYRQSWEDATGEHFGPVKSGSWKAPNAEAPESLSLLEENLEVTQHRYALSVAHKELYDLYRENLHKQIDSVAEELERTENAYFTMKDACLKRTDRPLHCPICFLPVTEKEGELDASPFCKYDEDLHQLHNLGAEWIKLNAQHDILQEIGLSFDDLDGTYGKPEPIKEEIRVVKTVLAQTRQTQKALTYFEHWQFCDRACHLLGPFGLRFDATKKAVALLQDELDDLAGRLLPNRMITFNPTGEGLDLLVNGHDYQSVVWKDEHNSVKCSLRILFQILAARRLDPATPILIDHFDTLGQPRRENILQAIVDAGYPTIIGQFRNDKPPTDLLKKAGKGQTYWLNNGILETVS